MTATQIRQRMNRAVRGAWRRVSGDDYTRPDGRCLRAPEWLVLVINNFCNLRCKMCDVGLGDSSTVFYTHLIGDDPRNMSLELLDQILSQATGFSPRPKIGLAYTEPLIHREILDICRMIVERGFFCSITTNGFLLPRLAEALVETGVDEITVSVDGPAEVHDRVRGRKGSFKNLYEGIERLNEARRSSGHRRPLVRLSYTITDENYTNMLDFVRQVENLAPASLTFSHLNFISDEMAALHNLHHPGELAVQRSNLGAMQISSLDTRQMWRALADLKAYTSARDTLPPVTIVPDLTSPDELDLYYQHPLTFIGGRACTDPWRLLMIRTDGTVVPAHGRCYNFPVGNLTETPLVDLWNNSRFRGFRQTLKQAGGSLPACARCCGVIGK
jgi:Fe-coproporphyrin III synthase